MPKVIKAPVKFLQKLETAVREGLSNAGIDKVEFISESIRNTKLNRVCVLADGFEYLRPSERQDLIWRIASQVLTREEQLRISMILTLTRDEMEGVEEVVPHGGRHPRRSSRVAHAHS